METTNLAMLDDEPMHLVTLAGIEEWRDQQQMFEVTYDVVGETADGMLEYRCRYQKLTAPQTYLLVKEPNSGEIEIILLVGWQEVQEHQLTYGDGRIVLLNANGSIQLV